MPSLLFLVLVHLATAQDPLKITWADCGSSGGKVTSLTVKPDPPLTNANFTTTAMGMITVPITDGTFRLVVTDIIPILSTSGPICSQTHVSLPFGAGDMWIMGVNC